MNPSFEFLAEEQVSLPVYAWTLEVTLEEDRPLARLEEAALRLAAAGVREFQRFVHLLGVDERLLAHAFGQLRLKSALNVSPEGYSVTSAGRRLLEKAANRTLRKVDLKVWHDPYRDELSWPRDDDDVLNARQQRDHARRVLPAPPELRSDVLSGRYRDLQVLIDRDGLPDDLNDVAPSEQAVSSAVVNVAPRHNQRYYVPGLLRVYRDPSSRELAFVLVRNGREDQQTSAALRDLDEQGVELVPLVPLAPLPGAAQRLQDRLSGLHPGGAPIPPGDTSKVQTLMERAVAQATGQVLLIAPFQRDGQADLILLQALRRRLLTQPALRAVVVVSLGRDQGRAGAADEVRQFLVQMQAIELLRERLSWHEVPGLAAQAAFMDGQWAVVVTRELAQHTERTGFGLPFMRYSFINNPRALTDVAQGIQELLSNGASPKQ